MQRGRGSPETPKARGVEAWLPALVLAVTELVLVVALIWFLIAARPLQARNELPKVIVPAAMVVAGVLAGMMLWRACRALLTVRKALRKN
jgi:hypothetical protein